MMRRLLIWMAVGLVAILVAGALVVRLSMSSPGGSFDVAGLAAPVAIHFDKQLRPYADASSIEDALFAEGWLHARYRLWQMELLRRAGNGRLAEGLGADLLRSDEALWRAGVPQLAARLEASASADMLTRVDAYVAGVNAALGELVLRPPELLLTGIVPQPWTRRDVYAVGAIIAFDSANNMGKERLRLLLAQVLDDEHFSAFLPDEAQTPGFPYVIRDRKLLVASHFLDSLDAFGQRLLPNASLGSSSWAVAPSRSASGHALFAFDSHDALSLPNLFYEVHLFYGTGKSIRGWSLPGLPGVINGFNERIAWGLTNIGDTQDLYIETRNPDNLREFLYDGQWKQARVEQIIIPVKGRAEPYEFELLTTPNGPLIEEEPPVSLRWTGHDTGGRGLDSLLAMNMADDWETFEAALDRHGAPSANVAYADVDGRIAFRTIGLIPQRGSGRGLLPLDGSRSANAWTAYVADQQLPSLVDPDHAYVAAANARVHDGEPLVSADNAPGYRIGRLHQVLANRGDFNLEDMQRLQLDQHNVQAASLLPHMLPAIRDAWKDDVEVAADWLSGWLEDPVNSADSAGALIWEHWYLLLARRVFGDALGDELLMRLLRESYMLNHALDRLIRDDHDSPWWQGRREALLYETLAEAMAALAETRGRDPANWRWDSVHTVSFRHELHGVSGLSDGWLSRGPYPWGGGNAVLARARYTYDRAFEGRAGATVRVVAEMSSPMIVRAVIPGGQHGHPSSGHYDDQLEVWLSGSLNPIATSPEEVDHRKTQLAPKP